jgi:hypothetical protein
VNGEIPETNIINTNLPSLDSQARPRPPKQINIICEEAVSL